MLYTIASAEWTPGAPLTPAEIRNGIFRTREEARRIGVGLRILAISICFDPARGLVAAFPPLSKSSGGSWTAPAIRNDDDGVIVFKTIPGSLVRLVGEPRIRVHAAGSESSIGPRLAGTRAAARR